jgi:hypothetical protein
VDEEDKIIDVKGGKIIQADDEDLPVVARLMVEIRSDGSRTIARGAMEDLLSGDKVAIEARGSTPMALALGLAKSMMRGKAFARSAARALLPRGKKKR